MTQSIGKKIASGATWMILARLLDRFIGVASTIILARLLVPGDFGLVAMATAIGAILDLFGAFSFDLALIQNPNAERRHYDTVWTFNVMFGLFCASSFALLAAPSARFYNEVRLENIMYALAVSHVLNGLVNVGIVDFRKEFKFRDEFIILLSRRIVTFAITVSGAYIFRSYWALVLGIIAGRLINVVMSYLMHPFRPSISLAGWGDLFHFSKWMFFHNVAYFMNQRAPDFIVAKMVGSHGLGLYSISYEISNMPTTEVAAPINRAIFPGYAKMATDKDSLRRGYLDVLSVLATIAMPAGIGIALISKYIVPVMLGEKWIETIPLIQFLAIYGALNVLQNNCGLVYIAQGDSRLTTMFSISFSILLIVSIIIFINFKGIMGVVWGYLIACGIIAPTNLYVAAKRLNLNLKDHIKILKRPIMASLGMATIILLCEKIFSNNIGITSDMLKMFFYVIVGVVIYTSIIIALWYLEGKPNGLEVSILRKITSKQQ